MPPTPIEAIIRSPIGSVRAWIAEDGTVRTSISAEFGAQEAEAGSAEAMAAVLAQATAAVRGLSIRATSPLDSSAFTDWLGERCEVDRAGRELTGALYDDFTAWCRSHGRDRIMSAAAFGSALRDRGFGLAGKDARGHKYRGGLRLKAPAAPRLAVAGE